MARSKTTAEPQTGYLRFSFAPELLGPTAAEKMREYYAECVAFEQQLAELQERRQTLLEQCRDIQLGVLMETGQELSDELATLQAESDMLIARRKALARDLLIDAQATLEARQREHDATVEGVRQRLAAAGVDASCLPMAHANPKAAARAFQHKLESEDECLASLGRLRQAESARRECEGLLGQPDGASVPLRWSSADGFARQVAELIGVGPRSEAAPIRMERRQYAVTA